MQIAITSSSTRELRNFGLTMGFMLPLVFGLLIPWLWDLALPAWPWVVAGMFWTLSLALPKLLVPVYRVWMKLAMGLGWLNNRLILGLVFYVFVLPTGMLLRLSGKDPMAQQLDVTAETYRIKKTPLSRDSMENPF